jgi:hypothetical protein
MNRNELKLRQRLAIAKGGHRRVLQGRLDALVAGRAPVVETIVPTPVTKKKSTKKKKS